MREEITLVRPLTPRSALDRRYRRTDDEPMAMAFQCAHVQERFALEAVVVSDDVGDRWVGAGDKSLCRLLSRSTPDLAAGGNADANYRFKTLQSLKSDLQPGDLTTYSIRIPNQDRHIYVAGIGQSVKRSDGVVDTARGVRRILRYAPPRSHQLQYSFAMDPDVTLQRQVIDAYDRWLETGPAEQTLTTGLFGAVDDRAYAGALGEILAPAMATLLRSGVVVGELWGRWRSGGRERSLGDGVFSRELRAAIREPRSGARLGRLIVELVHRHDRFALPTFPGVKLAWRQ